MTTDIKRLHRRLKLVFCWERFEFTFVPKDSLIALFSTICLLVFVGSFPTVAVFLNVGLPFVWPLILFGLSLCGLLARYPWEFLKAFRSLSPDETHASWLVPIHLRNRIEKIEDKTIGTESRFGRVLKRVRQIRHQAEQNLGEITRRLRDRPEATYLERLRLPNETVLEQARRVEAGLESLQEKIKVFLEGHYKAVHKTRDLLHRLEALEDDLALARDTMSLGQEMKEAEREALTAADEVIAQINGTVKILRHEITEVFDKSLMDLAVNLPIEDSRRYLDEVEGTIKQLGTIELKGRLPIS